VTDAEALESFERYRATGDRKLRNAIVEAHRWIATTCAQRFRERGEPFDDLVQVGLLGLVKAVERFDPTKGVPFAGFAMPTVTGELRRHFRDTTWSVHVPRRMKELSALIGPAGERLRERLGRHATVAELADELQTSVEDVLAAMEASSAYRATSLHVGGSSDASYTREPGEDDAGLGLAETRIALDGLLRSLPARERQILELRFLEDKTQAEIAAIVGTSQVHVSRLIRASLISLRHIADRDLERDMMQTQGDRP